MLKYFQIFDLIIGNITKMSHTSNYPNSKFYTFNTLLINLLWIVCYKIDCWVFNHYPIYKYFKARDKQFPTLHIRRKFNRHYYRNLHALDK